MTTKENPVPWLVERIVSTKFEDFPETTIAAAKTFLLDTFGVGVAGCYGWKLDEVRLVAAGWGQGDEATVWVSGDRLPAASAAFVNAYQIHSLEFDSVNEAAVLHPLATILSAVFAYAERRAARGTPVSGRDLLAAMILGVDVSVFLGKASTGPIRFFRPATAGGFGAIAALGRLEGFDTEQMTCALGTQYAQTSGTMQSHVEGSPLLGMQVGFNARAAVTSCDLTIAGIAGPKDVLTGPYGYLRLFEGGVYDISSAVAELNETFQVERMSHKPFPSGRLTHGIVDGLHRLMKSEGFGADDVAHVTCHVPQLVKRLCGRPDLPEPAPNYAKLCLPFVGATYMRHGKVDVEHFVGAEMLNDPKTHEYAALIEVVQDDNPSHSAISPQRVVVTLKSGATHAIDLPFIYGHYEVPLTREEHLDKFFRCWGRAEGMVPANGQRLSDMVDGLETLADVSDLVAMMVPERARAAAE
ncbi:MmgE/PrpD family protein [Allosediminivita pacifica]|uniref:2-methylcitrate dehydratase PrpD n=1 Tax=Allosediminivita pacifica TaxID=1267769 RepID=A0A2T6ATR2_9RHOB|nr:MmgE/PrpD family protein [Allosediminivita pacifica]PTX47207.1 2-methylcitrate dehydratase PrpD [Allosediminivita pacifica]GGB09424.1 hypothetical protein GCM10011324_19320 [Allosediminivita pacifica]